MNAAHPPRTAAEDELQLADLVEELTAKLQRGEPCDISDYARRYPEHAERLHNWMSVMTAMADLGHSLSGEGGRESLAAGESAFDGDPPVAKDCRPLPAGVLGDFRLIREIGRGGMGVVYEAEQLSIGRRVALKVLPFAAMLDKQQLNRFKNEARAAGTLDHPNIVSVFSVGVERGVHFYAMQLIEGESLAQIVARLRAASPPLSRNAKVPRSGARPSNEPPNADRGSRTESPDASVAATTPFSPQSEIINPKSEIKSPSPQSAIPKPQSEIPTAVAALSTLPAANPREYFRTVARLGIQAAEALDHAHQNGILHRDVKPANLMVDDAGKLWVTDFGLARLEADAGMTMTGDLVGTLRYMSPEQALAKRVVVDHRSDVYSLGATLYELLALRPPFAGDDRQELLRQIAFDEPKKLRHVNARIPQDIETVVLKAIEKNPADRYATAQHLGSDLQRFLHDRPILAQPPRTPQIALKYARRHPRLLATICIGTALCAVLLAVSTAVVTAALAESRAAKLQVSSERDRFRVQRDLAEQNLYVANIRVAHDEWNQTHLTAVDTLLAAHLPREGEGDVRNWEWYYLQSICSRDLETLRGHSAEVTAVAWSPDGQRLATGSDDATVKIWDAANPRELVTLRGHTDRILSVAWSPDGTKLASGSRDDVVRIWDLATGAARELPVSDPGMEWIAWSPDGTRLAVCGSFVRVWDADSGDELWRTADHDALRVAWSPDSRQLASVSSYQRRDICIWRADTGELLHVQPNAHNFTILAVAWSPDGERIATASMDQRVKVWDAESWSSRTLQGHAGTVRSVAWNPDGTLVASAGDDGTVILWNPDEDRPVRTIRGHRGPIRSVQWRNDGKRLASASADGAVKIWDPDRDQQFTRIGAGGGMVWRPDGKQVGCIVPDSANDKRFAIQTFDPSTAVPVGGPIPIGVQLTEPADVTTSIDGVLAWSPSAQHIAYVSTPSDLHRNTIKVADASTRTEVCSLTIPAELGTYSTRALEWSPDSSLLAAGIFGQKNSVLIWNFSTGQMITQLLHDEPLESVAWSPDGRWLASASSDNLVKIWDTSNWRETARFNRHPDSNGSQLGGRHIVAWSPDGNILAAGTMRGWVILWDWLTKRELLSFSAHTAQVRSIAFSPDGSRLATASQDHNVKIWDVNGGRHLLTLQGHTSVVYDVAWSPDSTRLLSTGVFENLIWDASTAMNK